MLEEDELSAAELENELRRLGCDVTRIADTDMFGGSRLLARVAKEPFDLILLSVDPASLGGISICERVKRDPRSRQVPVVLMGTDLAALVANESPDTRADGYLQKPVEPDDLITEVRGRFPWLVVPSADSYTRLTSTAPSSDEEDVDEQIVIEWDDGSDIERFPTEAPAALDETWDLLERERLAHQEELLSWQREHDRAFALLRAEHETQLANAAQSAREELEAEAQAQQEKHWRIIERLTASLEEESAALGIERAARAEREAAYARVVAEVAHVNAERDQAQQEARAEIARLTAEREALQRDAVADLVRIHEERDQAKAEAARELARLLAEREAETLTVKGEAERQGTLREASERAAEAEVARGEALRLAAARAAHAAVEQAQAEREAAESQAVDALAALDRERAAHRRAIKDLEVAQAAELARLDESLALMLEQERTAASARLAEANAAALQAVVLSIGQTRRAEQKELTLALEANERAHEQELEAERAKVAAALTEAALQPIVALDPGHAAALSAVERERDELARDHERLRRKLEAQRIEHEAALWSATVETNETVKDERSRTASAVIELERRQAASLRDLELALERETARAQQLETSAHAAESMMAELEAARRKLASELESQVAQHEAALGRAALAPLLRLRRIEETLNEEQAKAALAVASAQQGFESRRAELEAERDLQTARRAAAEQELAAESAARTELSRQLAVIEAEHRTVRDAAEVRVRTAEADLTTERARVDAAHAELSATLAARDATHRTALAVVEAALATERAAGRDAATELARVRDAHVTELATARAQQAAAETALSELRTAHRAELLELDESLDRMLEQERVAHSDLLAETRAAALEAVALGVAEAKRAARGELEAALADAEAKASDRLRAAEALATVALAEQKGVAEDAYRDVAAARDHEAERAAGFEDELRVVKAARDFLTSERDRLYQALEAELLARDAEAERFAQYEEAREFAAAARAREADLANAERAEAQRVEREGLEAQLAGVRARLVEAERERLEEVARLAEAQAREARAAEGRRLLDAEELAKRTVERDEEAARATDLESELRTLQGSKDDVVQERDHLLQSIEALKREHEASTGRAAIASDERVRRVEQELAEASGRHVELLANRDALATLLHNLEAELVTLRATAAETFEDRQALRQQLEQQRAEHEAALYREASLAEDRLQDAEERLEAERARAASSLASSEAEWNAQKAALVFEREGLEAKLGEVQARLVDADRERLEEVARLAEAQASEARAAEEQRQLDAAELAKRTVERDEQAARATSLEAARDASALEQERILQDFQKERTLHEQALGHAFELARRDLVAEEEKYAALEARFAAAEARLAENVAAHARESARAEVVESELRTLQGSKDEVVRERDRLLQSIEALKREHEASTGRAATASDERVRRVEQELAEASGRHVELLANRDALAAVLHNLEAELVTLRATAAETFEDRQALRQQLELQRAEHEAALYREASLAEDRLQDAEERLEAERARAASSLASSEAEWNAQKAALVFERDERTARSLALEKDLESSRAVRADLSREQQKLQRELEALRAGQEAALERAALESKERLRLVEQRLAQSEAREAAARAATAAELEARRLELAAERDRQGARRRELEAEHAAALQGREVAHAETLARLQREEASALGDLQRALAQQTMLAQASETKLVNALAAHEERLEVLRKELGSALGALAAERQRRVEDVPAKSIPTPSRSSDSLRAIRPDAPRRERTGAPGLRPSGEQAVTHADPPGVLRAVLTRALGGEGRADLVLAAILGAADRKELPGASDELLALLERHLHAELRGQIGDAGAQLVMDELAKALVVARVAAVPKAEPVSQRRTTKPPPPPPSESPPSTKNTMRPPTLQASHTAHAGDRRAVLVIDKDRMTRANLSRALARAGCEITARDSCAGVGVGAEEFDVIVTETADVGIEELLSTFRLTPAPCAIIAWTASVEAARAIFDRAGLTDVAVVEKDARTDALVATVRARLGKLLKAAT